MPELTRLKNDLEICENNKKQWQDDYYNKDCSCQIDQSISEF